MIILIDSSQGTITVLADNGFLWKFSEKGPHVAKCKPRKLLCHVGVNNLSKTFLYESEFHQIQSTQNELQNFEKSLKEVTSKYDQTKVIFSSVLVTKDGFVNARADILNEAMRLCCYRNNWTFMNTDNIMLCHLRDAREHWPCDSELALK